MHRYASFAGLASLSIVAATSVQCGSGSDGGGVDNGFRLEVAPAEGTFHQPAAIIVNAYLVGTASYTADGGTFSNVIKECNGPGSCGATLTPTAEGQTTAGTVVMQVTVAPHGQPFYYAPRSVSATYHFIAGTPTFAPPAGNLAGGTTVTITSVTPGFQIHYTLDGNDPTDASPTYTGPISLSTSATVKAIAVVPGYKNSDVASAKYAADQSWLGLCAQWNATLVQRTIDCFLTDSDYLAGLPGAIDCASTQADIDDLQTTFDGTHAADCSATLAALTCDQLAPRSKGPFRFPMPGTPCASVVVGLNAPAAACNRNTQCASGYCTSTETRTCPGACQARVALGGACTNLQECADGLTCDTHTSKCAAYATSGATCVTDDDCSDDLRCWAYKCQAPLATGAGCNYSIKCVAGDVCNVTCQPIVGLGSPCTPPAMEDTCAAGSRCSGTTCTALPKVGENCAQTQACAGGYCDNLSGTPTCTAYRNIGDACDQDQQCASQLCSAQKCVAPGEFYCHSV